MGFIGNSERPTVAIIDMDALRFNYHQLRKKLPKGVGILGVVKADAYGHGSVPVSLELEGFGIDYLGVAISDEAVELRGGGVKAPILVLGGLFSREDVEKALKFGLTPVVFEKECLKALSELGPKMGKRIRVHIKVDTGMGRLGVPIGMWADFLNFVKRLKNIEVEGIMSHFAMTGQEGKDFSRYQWGVFQEALSTASNMRLTYRYVHMANSSHTILYRDYLGNLVRPGIMLYGAFPSPDLRGFVNLKPVMTLKTRVYFVKKTPPGSRIGYGGTFETKRESLIASLPVGYADGYSYLLSNRGEVLIRGRRAPVAGRVCMDFTLVDVTEIPRVRKGDEVVLIGTQGKDQITAEELADKTGSIPYEIFCSIGKRVPRVYKGKSMAGSRGRRRACDEEER